MTVEWISYGATLAADDAAQLRAEAVAARLRSGAEAPYIIYYAAGGTPADIPLAPLIAARTCGRRDRAGFGTWAPAAQLSG